MPPGLEKKLKKEYGAKSDIPYKIMNKMGLMHKEIRHSGMREKLNTIAKKKFFGNRFSK